MWATLRYAVFFVGGFVTAAIALSAFKTKPRQDYKLGPNPEKQLKEALNKNGL